MQQRIEQTTALSMHTWTELHQCRTGLQILREGCLREGLQLDEPDRADMTSLIAITSILDKIQSSEDKVTTSATINFLACFLHDA